MKMFHVQTARGEAVAFSRQGHSQEAVVVMIHENGKRPIERRLSCWSDDAQRLWEFARDFGLINAAGA